MNCKLLLLIYEQKINRSTIVEEQALKAYINTYSNCYRGRGQGQGRGDHGAKDSSRNFGISNDQFQAKCKGRNHVKLKVECIPCHKFDHYASKCYSRLPIHEDNEESAKFVEEKGVEALLTTVQDGSKPDPEIWFVDTGFGNHMCGSKSLFSSLNEDFHSVLHFSDCLTIKVMGKGDTKIKTKNGFAETISNVPYVLDLKSNL